MFQSNFSHKPLKTSHLLNMLTAQWAVLATVTACVLSSYDNCSSEGFPALPANYGNYTGRTFNVMASTHLSENCWRIRLNNKNLYLFTGSEVSEYDDGRELSPRCDLHTLCKVKVEAIEDCMNIYEKDSWLLIVGYTSLASLYLQFILGVDKSINLNDTREFLYNWLDELNITNQNTCSGIQYVDCSSWPKNELTSKPTVSRSLLWFFVMFIPPLVTLISIITTSVKKSLIRHSNRVTPLRP